MFYHSVELCETSVELSETSVELSVIFSKILRNLSEYKLIKSES